jgi:hypothetical protein
LDILRLFADGASPNAVFHEAGLNNYEEGERLCQWFTNCGLLVPAEPEVVSDENFPLSELAKVI